MHEQSNSIEGSDISVKNAKIVYFSGTGGTARVSKALENALLDRGLRVQRVSLNIKDCSIIDPHEGDNELDLLIIVFVVHACDAPSPIYEWIKCLADGNGKGAAVISVSGGGEVFPNTACREGVIELLEEKGYNVFYERMMVMPSNWMVETKEQLAVRLLQILPQKSEHCVCEILSGVRRRKKSDIDSRMVTRIFKSQREKTGRVGRDINVNDSCTGCGWCEENCPRGNIKIVGARPIFGDKCLVCLRCIYGCPNKALYFRKYGFITVKHGYNLDELEKRMNTIILEPLENVKTGILFMGIIKYLKNMEV